MGYGSSSAVSSSAIAGVGMVFIIIGIVWAVLYYIQIFLGYGTAYRQTKANGDNGVSLFGWIIVYCSLAALVPGLGIYLWSKSKKNQQPYGAQAFAQTQYGQQYAQQPVPQQYGQQVSQTAPFAQQQVAQPVQAVQTSQQVAQPVQPVSPASTNNQGE